MITHHRSKRTVSGGRYKDYRAKRLFEKASAATLSKLGNLKKKVHRQYGGKIAYKTLQTDTVNVVDPKTKKFSKSKIKTISQSPANPNYVRRNIITKGTIIDTEAGKARVTNSPGREGSINAVLVH